MKFRHRHTSTQTAARRIQGIVDQYRSVHSDEEQEFGLRKWVMAFGAYNELMKSGMSPTVAETLSKSQASDYIKAKGITKSEELPDPVPTLKKYGAKEFAKFILSEDGFDLRKL